MHHGKNCILAIAINGNIRSFLFISLLLLTIPVAASPVDYVIHVSIDGLRSDAITILGRTGAPNFYRLRAEGAFTDNARIDVHYLGTLPNHASQLTGRGVKGPAGHNYGDNRFPPLLRTLHSNKKSYIASIFDVAHDHGLSTALYTGKEKFQIFKQSYNGTNGAPDQKGVDNGRNKIDHYVYIEDTDKLVNSYIATMRSTPVNYTLLHLHDPDSAGHEDYWDVTLGSEYMNAVAKVDGLIGKLLDMVTSNPRLSEHAVIILTADHGGTYGSNHTILDSRKNYTIPFYVWGAGVPAGVDLYELNKQTRLDPGSDRPSYSAPVQPVRGGDAANLALDLLGLEPIDGSTINLSQDLTVTHEYSARPLAWIASSAQEAGLEIATVSSSNNTVIKNYRPLQCKDSSSPLFQAAPNDVLKLEIISDFSHINKEIYSETGGDSAIILYQGKNGTSGFLPVFIKDRGHSRRDFCEWVPLRIIFEDPIIKKKLDQTLKGMSPDKESLVKLYNELKTLRKGKSFNKGYSQGENLFSNLGDDIKLVTHCGKSSWKRVGGETQQEQEKRLLQEYYIYQVLDQLHSVTLKTRLAEITYRDPEGNILLTRKAFFREPKSRLAKRCGLSKRPYPGVESKDIDDLSWFQLQLYNEFVYFKDYGRDGRNINMLYREDGKIFVGPYDFDLSGIIVPDYRPNSASLEDNLQHYFQSWIKYHDGDEMAAVQIFFMVANKNNMRKVLENSLLNGKNKKHMLNWFDSYMAVLEQFVETNQRLMPALFNELKKRASP